MAGHRGFEFIMNHRASMRPPAQLSGVSIHTGTADGLFFPASTTFGGTGGLSSGLEDWTWTYASSKDNCGKVEHWIDADAVGNGTAAGDGDITAPAPGCPV